MKSVKIGKFDIFATYTYAKGIAQGMADDEAKVYGYSIAVLGAQAKMGNRKGGGSGGSVNPLTTLKEAAEKKKKGKVSITADQYDKQIVTKLGEFYHAHFLKDITRMVSAGKSYDEVKALVNIPSTWGAKISSEDFIANMETV